MRFCGFKEVSFLTQGEKEQPGGETIGDICENIGEKEVIVATNLTSILYVVPIHSESSPETISIHLNSNPRGGSYFINIKRFSTLDKLVRVTN